MSWNDDKTSKLSEALTQAVIDDTPVELLELPGNVEIDYITIEKIDSVEEDEDGETQVVGTGTLEAIHHIWGGADRDGMDHSHSYPIKFECAVDDSGALTEHDITVDTNSFLGGGDEEG